jgi:hypothetical protein
MLMDTAERDGKLDYIMPLQQELNNNSKKIFKQSLNLALETVTVAGGVATATGVGAVVGGALITAAGISKIVAEFGFAVIDEAELYQARKLQRKAAQGDRHSMLLIMGQSARYAKMFLVLGALEGDSIALEFLRVRGISEADLKDEKVSRVVLRKMLRQRLLQEGGEQDSHDSKFKAALNLPVRIKSWHGYISQERDFWSENTMLSYDRFLKLYNVIQFQQLVDDFNSTTGVPAKISGVNTDNLQDMCKIFKLNHLRLSELLTQADLNVKQLEEEDIRTRGARPSLEAELRKANDVKEVVLGKIKVLDAFIKTAKLLPEEISSLLN